jgi:hypothetical protein
MISTCDSVALILVSPVLPLRMSVRGYSFARCTALRDRTDCDDFWVSYRITTTASRSKNVTNYILT